MLQKERKKIYIHSAQGCAFPRNPLDAHAPARQGDGHGGRRLPIPLEGSAERASRVQRTSLKTRVSARETARFRVAILVRLPPHGPVSVSQCRVQLQRKYVKAIKSLLRLESDDTTSVRRKGEEKKKKNECRMSCGNDGCLQSSPRLCKEICGSEASSKFDLLTA
jgi:hypothetical protein